MSDNPFSLDFEAEPNLYIPRISEQNKIIDTFKADIPSSHIFMITGARGTVKSIRDKIDMDSNMFSTYKDTLEKSGILSRESAYGRTELSLPYFGEYIKNVVSV